MMKQRIPISLTVACLIALTAPPASADVTLAKVFGSNMVLQRDRPAPIWGAATPGDTLTVTFAGQTHTATADKKGNWRITLTPLKASAKGRPLAVQSTIDNRQSTIEDVLVGDVWLCSGQSNMAFALRSAASAKTELPAADHPRIRLLHMIQGTPGGRSVYGPKELARCTPEKYFAGTWTTCTPETAKNFSAVAYFFGRDLHQATRVPVGLIHNAVGGTPTEAWMSRATLEADPQFRELLEDWPASKQLHPFMSERSSIHLKAWREAATKAKAAGQPAPPMPGHPFKPAFLYESGIAPLMPFAIRGVIWYQGESNSTNPQLHERLFPAMIRDWRKGWGQKELPFLFVQLPGMGTSKGYRAEKWPEFREGQARALSLPNTGMAVTIDVGNPTNVHPRDKRTVGRRLALIARAKVYGEKIVCSGPALKSLTAAADGRGVTLTFDCIGGGLAVRGGGKLTGFETAGRDGKFTPAEATIQGDTVLVATTGKPTAIRYAWAPFPDANLINKEGLPAAPFRTNVGKD
jgi:sialate O-acetylesterase